ncbi:helix-turn-helix domain-containing protein, partial [Arcobacter defluvii]|uniref:helix-turn-helix domain-containing protein n=1 Tax=Arcobacter defluvii TaxID=873191 RepID=UPI0019D6AED6
MKYDSSIFSKLSWECELIEAISSVLKNNTKVSNEIVLTSRYKLVNYAKEFINDNYSQNFTLDDFAKEFDISKYHFLRLFKKHTFVSPHTYLMIRRVEKAKQFLRKNANISEIAYLC